MKTKLAIIGLSLFSVASANVFAQTAPPAVPKSPALIKAEADLLKAKKDLQLAIADSASLSEKLDSVTQKNEALQRENASLDVDKASLQNVIKYQITYSCDGPTRKTAQDYDKINLYVDIEGDEMAELASRIRQLFRSIQDIQIVFSAKEADVSVAMIGFQVKGQQSLPLGYAISITTTQLCASTFMGTDYPITVLSNHYLRTGPYLNNENLSSGIVSTIDTDDIEPMRATLSQRKKSSGF